MDWDTALLATLYRMLWHPKILSSLLSPKAVQGLHPPTPKGVRLFRFGPWSSPRAEDAPRLWSVQCLEFRLTHSEIACWCNLVQGARPRCTRRTYISSAKTIEEFQVLTQPQTSVPRRRLGCTLRRLLPLFLLLLSCISKSAERQMGNRRNVL
jgi:hypothetical protein